MRRGGGGIKKAQFPLVQLSAEGIQGLSTLPPCRREEGGKSSGAWAREYSFKTFRGANKEIVCIF
jgi:hypothetical protein